MSKATPIPRPLPVALQNYTKEWMDSYTRMLEITLTQMQARQAMFGTTINLNRLPTSATGLRSGDVWCDTTAGNVLKLVP